MRGPFERLIDNWRQWDGKPTFQETLETDDISGVVKTERVARLQVMFQPLFAVMGAVIASDFIQEAADNENHAVERVLNGAFGTAIGACAVGSVIMAVEGAGWWYRAHQRRAELEVSEVV